ncbi:hypothetical protein FRX31_027256 [Thalictrum thalictroides]|uniref:Uncharacterized protein n=1 Tax=Thalictrum thalictroides TaxID=46969 RepID=A0A7J6VEW2_THATH|nr:hypothetical protein FRX31_027256 [Thalictrum thalictroides]
MMSNGLVEELSYEINIPKRSVWKDKMFNMSNIYLGIKGSRWNEVGIQQSFVILSMFPFPMS